MVLDVQSCLDMVGRLKYFVTKGHAIEVGRTSTRQVVFISRRPVESFQPCRFHLVLYISSIRKNHVAKVVATCSHTKGRCVTRPDDKHGASRLDVSDDQKCDRPCIIQFLISVRPNTMNNFNGADLNGKSKSCHLYDAEIFGVASKKKS